MPARVEYRLGSIFDEKSDILVIPMSAGGTVTPSMAGQMRNAGVPHPLHGVPWGEITWIQLTHPKYRFVVYAASVAGQTSSTEVVQQIGKAVGKLSFVHRLRRVSAPLLGTGAGDLLPNIAAEALKNGFQETALDAALLKISVTDPDVFATLGSKKRGMRISDLLDREIQPLGERERPATPPRLWSPPQPALPSVPALSKATPPGASSAAEVKPQRSRVFISYSHADTEWLERLQKHLRPLEREGAVIWDDTRLKAGVRWREEIRNALAETKVAILLVSADFLASEFITTNELPPLLKAAEEDGATILPVIISPSRFDRTESLSRFQAVNDPAKPLVAMRRGNREKVLDQVARAVEDALGK